MEESSRTESLTPPVAARVAGLRMAQSTGALAVRAASVDSKAALVAGDWLVSCSDLRAAMSAASRDLSLALSESEPTGMEGSAMRYWPPPGGTPDSGTLLKSANME